MQKHDIKDIMVQDAGLWKVNKYILFSLFYTVSTHIDIPGQYKMRAFFFWYYYVYKKFQKGMLCILLVPASPGSLKG